MWNVVGILKVKFGKYLKNFNCYNGDDFKLEEDMIMESRKLVVKCIVIVSIGCLFFVGIVLVLE